MPKAQKIHVTTESCPACGLSELTVETAAAQSPAMYDWYYAEQTRLQEMEHHLFNILAVYHRDGGHYTAEHGVQKSVEDMITKYYKLLATEEEAVKLWRWNINLADDHGMEEAWFHSDYPSIAEASKAQT